MALAFGLAVTVKSSKPESCRAIYFYIAVYLLTEIPFLNGYYPKLSDGSPDRLAIYFILGSASFLLILLYHSLDMTKLLFAAGLIELSLIALNIISASDVIVPVFIRANLTVMLNLTALLLLLGNWINGFNFDNKYLYRRLYSFDRLINSAFGINSAMDKKMGKGQE